MPPSAITPTIDWIGAYSWVRMETLSAARASRRRADERLAGQPLASERLDERLGAHLADHLAALLGDVGTCPRLSGRSIVAGAGAGLRRLRSGGRRREIDLADRPVSRVDGERDAILFAGLAAPDPGRALREPGSAVVVDLNDFPVLRNVGFEPGELRAKKGVDVGRVAAVLVGRGEQVFGPDDAEGRLLFLAELRVAGEHLALGERIGDRVPGAVWPFFGFCFVHTAACSERGAEAIVRRYRSSGMSPRPMCSSIAGWMLPRSRSLRTCRSGTAKAVAIASSVQFFEARSSIDRQRSTGDIGARTTFSATARMSSSGSAGLTRIAISLSLLAMALLDAAAARDDGEGPVLLFGEERRLNESDRIAVGLEGCVGQAIGGDLPRVSLVGVIQGLGIDDAQFDCLFHCLAPVVSGSAGSLRNREPRERGRGAGAKAAQRAGIRSGPAKRPAEPTLCGGRAAVLVGPSRL